MKGWLIVNEFLQTPKFEQLYDMFEQQAKKMHIILEKKTNGRLAPVLEQTQGKEYPDFILFWDKDILLARYFEALGIPVFNSSHAIEVCDNKCLTHLCLWKQKIPSPKTIPAPMTYFNIGYPDLSFLDHIEKELGYPMICKEAFGSFGEQVYFIQNRLELEKKTKSLAGKTFLYQQFVKSSYGRDLRIQVVGEKVIAAMYRYSEQDFRANITAGGKMRPYIPSAQEAELAVAACRAVGADFAGVDLLLGETGERFVCEVNSNAHFKNIEDCTGVSVATYILQYIINTNFLK